MPRAVSAHRTVTAYATSSGWIRRRCGLICSRAARAWSVDRPVLSAIRAIASPAMLVSTQPGQIALIVTPVRARSIARARVIPTTACLEAQYAAVYAYPDTPAFDATLTTRPQPA